MIFIGCDPGASGAVALLGPGASPPDTIRLDATPADVWAFLDGRALDGAFALLERVSAMPRQGVASTFKFGTSYGRLQGFLVAAGIPYEEVTPGTWQRAMGCLSKGDKRVTKRKAQELFPALKVTHAVADALLLAELARRLHASRASKP